MAGVVLSTSGVSRHQNGAGDLQKSSGWGRARFNSRGLEGTAVDVFATGPLESRKGYVFGKWPSKRQGEKLIQQTATQPSFPWPEEEAQYPETPMPEEQHQLVVNQMLKKIVGFKPATSILRGNRFWKQSRQWSNLISGRRHSQCRELGARHRLAAEEEKMPETPEAAGQLETEGQRLSQLRHKHSTLLRETD